MKDSRGKGKEALGAMVGENVWPPPFWCLDTRFIIIEF